jgi:hypothetical protein
MAGASGPECFCANSQSVLRAVKTLDIRRREREKEDNEEDDTLKGRPRWAAEAAEKTGEGPEYLPRIAALRKG